MGDPKSKFEALVMLYKFGIQSFQSLHTKVKVILKRFKSLICPFFIFNPNFKMQAESEIASYIKVVDLEILNNFYFWRFSYSIQNLKVILKIQIRVSVLAR